jgi:hypothetical protein
MNDKTSTKPQPELQVIDLGEAKALTLGLPFVLWMEDNPFIPLRIPPPPTRVA